MKKVLMNVIVLVTVMLAVWFVYDWSIIKLITLGIIPDNGYGLSAEVENWKNIVAYITSN